MMFFWKKKVVEVVETPKPDPDHILEYSENEVSVWSHVDGGYYLKNAEGLEYKRRSMHYIGESKYDNYAFFSEEYTDWTTKTPGVYVHPVTYNTKDEAIIQAQKLEKEADAKTREKIRRENFVSEKVWR